LDTKNKKISHLLKLPINQEMFHKVGEVYKKHFTEITSNWQAIGSHYCQQMLVSNILPEFKKEWPRECAELLSITEKDSQIKELFNSNVLQAYSLGYMHGKDLISLEELTNAASCIGELFAEDIKSKMKNAKSKGRAFTILFINISVVGHTGVWRENMQINSDRVV
jgi:hypothetical protein